ncbi:MAG TPA: GspE/PulE family protein [Polyangiaceae bacterium]|nr:GspE/PulE family protein [Polyangiaceae bacterium]
MSDALVTLGLINGQARTGRLGAFSPSAPDVVIEVEPVGGRRLPREIIPAERIAYVAHHRMADAAASPIDPQAPRYKVYVAGQKTFKVQVKPEASVNGTGFSAIPAEDSAFREIFFYHHGVSARERDQPIGEMLVSAGVIHPDALQHAIVAQCAQRAIPIGEILVEQRKVSSGEIAQAAVLQQRKKMRIGEILVQAGLAKPEDIDLALAEQRKRRGKRLGEVLVDLNIISEVALAKTLAQKFETPFVDLDTCILNPRAPLEIPKDLIIKYGVLPVDTDARSLTVAISDPLALEAIDMLRFHANRRVDEVLVTASQLRRHVADFLAKTGVSPAVPEQGGLDQLLKQLADSGAIDDEEAATDTDEKPTDSTIVNLVNQIIVDAFRRGSSDIHIEPNGKEEMTVVRFRIDGECVAGAEIPPQHRNSVVARIKIMAKLDIAERRKPQDGKIKFRLADRQIELRVATVPTVHGEDVVMRILASSKPMPLEQLRLSERNLKEMQGLVAQPYGLVLCVGPTGSGKTTTLHSALGSINTVDMKIWTAEDPVEITQKGLRQVQVNARIGFTFAQAMRAFLRCDPDVIMVGEMRDHETAATAIEASLTGHLVLSTLHTNSAPETVTRLLDMGLDPFSFGDALLGVLAQRLARALCGKCKLKEPCTDDEREEMRSAYGPELFDQDFGGARGFPVYRAKGCPVCSNSGYKGRIGLHELLVASDAIQKAIVRKGSVDEIRELSIEGGMRTLLQDGISKVVSGDTDLKQVFAVCSR